MTSGEATRRSGAGGSWRDASVNAPVRTRSATEQRSLSTAMWCRGISLVVLVVGTGVGVLYASAKMRFVEDVLPKISGTYLDCFGVPQNPRRMNPSLILPTSLGGSSRCENFGKEWHFSFANVTHPSLNSKIRPVHVLGVQRVRRELCRRAWGSERHVNRGGGYLRHAARRGVGGHVVRGGRGR